MKIESSSRLPRVLTTAALAAGLLALSACSAPTPCDDGFYEGDDYLCHPIPDPTAGDTTFGKTCAAASDCGGDAPVCAAPQLPYCTQISCSAGEANEGKCPSGWTCVPSSGSAPSACVKM